MSRDAVPSSFDHPCDAAEFKRPARAGVELYRAHIVHHAFDPHTHEAYGIGAIESGVERFRYGGGDHLAPPCSLVLMNPDVLHTGRAETAQGWRYRMAYLDTGLLDALSGEPGWWFDVPVVHHPAAAQRVSLLLAGLWRSDDPLAVDCGLLELVQTLRPHARGAARPVASTADRALDRAVELMHAELGHPLTLERLAAAAGWSPFHFLRRFKARHDVTPHQMLMALRLFEAKRLLAAGRAPAAVAADVGLVDQAHLTRRFARMYGVTPARYQQQLGTRPAR